MDNVFSIKFCFKKLVLQCNLQYIELGTSAIWAHLKFFQMEDTKKGHSEFIQGIPAEKILTRRQGMILTNN